MSLSDADLQKLKTTSPCDVNVIVRNASYKCHWVILAAFSKYFRSKGKPCVKNYRLSLPVGPTSFRMVRDFMYGHGISLTAATVLDVWRTADLLGLSNPAAGEVSLQDKCKMFWETSVMTSWRSCFNLLAKAAKIESIVDIPPQEQKLAECKNRFVFLVEHSKAMEDVLLCLVKLEPGQTEQLLSVLNDVPLPRHSPTSMWNPVKLSRYFQGSPPRSNIDKNVTGICKFVLDRLQWASGVSHRAVFTRESVPAPLHLLSAAYYCYVLDPTESATANFVKVFQCLRREEVCCISPETLAEWIHLLFPNKDGYVEDVGEIIGEYATSALEENPAAVSVTFFYTMADLMSKTCSSHGELYDLIALYVKKKPQTSQGLTKALATMLDLGKLSAAKAREIGDGGWESRRLMDAILFKLTPEDKSRKRSFAEMSEASDSDVLVQAL